METSTILTYGYSINEVEGITDIDPVTDTSNSTPGYSEDEATFVGNASNFFTPPTLPDEYSSKQVALMIIFGLISVVTILANAFVLYIFSVGKQRLRNPTNLLLANLAVADLLVGLIVMPLLASVTILNDYWIFGDFLCFIFDYFHFLLCGASMWSMIMVGVDRFIGVTRPLQYKNIMTRNRTIFVIIFIWLAAFCLTSGPLTYWPKTMSGIETLCFLNLEKHFLRFVIFFVYWIPITSTIVIYFLVYRNAVAPFKRAFRKATSVSPKQKSDLTSATSKQARLAKSIALLTGTIFLFYSPVFGTFIVKAFYPHYFTYEILMLTGWIRYCCSTVNPFMYALAVPGYRQEIAEKLFGIRKRGKMLDESITQSYPTGSDESNKHYEEKPEALDKKQKTGIADHRYCTQCGFLMKDFLPNKNARCDKCHRQILCSSWMLPTTWGTCSYFICPKCPTIRFFDGIQPCFCQNCNHKFAPNELRPPHEKLASLTTIATKPTQQVGSNTHSSQTGNPQILVNSEIPKTKIQQKTNVEQKGKVIERLRESVILPYLEQRRSIMTMNHDQKVDTGAFVNTNSISLDELEQIVAELERSFGINLEDKNNS